MKPSYVYMMSNKWCSTIYIGVTSDIELRIRQHKSGNGSKHTTLYNQYYLTYFEEFSNIEEAIKREKQLKKWNREWKFNLAKKQNPDLIDLAKDW